MYLVGHAQYCLLAYHRSDQRLTIGPKQEEMEIGIKRERESECLLAENTTEIVEKVESEKKMER